MVTKKKKERKKETSEWSHCKGLSAHLLSINWIQCIVRKLWGLLVQELLLPYLLEGSHEVSRRCPSKGPFPRILHAKAFSELRARCPTIGLEPPGTAERVQRQTVLSSLAIYVLSCGDM